MRTTAIIVWVYGALVLVGGVVGYAKARSVPSLISGAVFGVAFICLGFGILRERSPASLWATILAAVLAVLMGARFAKTRKFMPAGLIAALSILVLAALLVLR